MPPRTAKGCARGECGRDRPLLQLGITLGQIWEIYVKDCAFSWKIVLYITYNGLCAVSYKFSEYLGPRNYVLIK